MKEITLKWKKEGKKYQNMINTEEILSAMEGIRKGYPENNEISTKLCRIIPKMRLLEIDFDRNQDYSEAPFIMYKIINGEEGIIKIINNHKVIWAMLNEYCKIEG